MAQYKTVLISKYKICEWINFLSSQFGDLKSENAVFQSIFYEIQEFSLTLLTDIISSSSSSFSQTKNRSLRSNATSIISLHWFLSDPKLMLLVGSIRVRSLLTVSNHL